MTSDQIVQIILALIGLAGTLITVFLVPLIKSKTTTEQREFAALVVAEAVKAAEQIFNASGMGIDKYDFVVKYIKAEFNLKLTEKELKVLIEAAVQELKRPKEMMVIK